MCVEKLISFFASNGRQGSIWKDQQNRKCVFVPYKSKSLSFPLEGIEWWSLHRWYFAIPLYHQREEGLGENKIVVPFSICTDCTNDFGVFIRHRIKMNKYLIRFTFCYSYSDLEKWFHRKIRVLVRKRDICFELHICKPHYSYLYYIASRVVKCYI